MERVGDGGAVGECERCSELSVDFSQQTACVACVELSRSARRACRFYWMGRGTRIEASHFFQSQRARWLSSAARPRAGVRSLAEVVRLFAPAPGEVREFMSCLFNRVGFVLDELSSSARSAAPASDLFNDHGPQSPGLGRSCPEDVQDHGHRPRHGPVTGRRGPRWRRCSAPARRRSRAGFDSRPAALPA